MLFAAGLVMGATANDEMHENGRLSFAIQLPSRSISPATCGTEKGDIPFIFPLDASPKTKTALIESMTTREALGVGQEAGCNFPSMHTLCLFSLLQQTVGVPVSVTMFHCTVHSIVAK